MLLIVGERVQVGLDTALEEEGSLRDDRDPLTEGMQSQLQGIGIADCIDGACFRFSDSKQCLDDGGLAGAGSADNPNFLTGLDGEGEVLEHQRQLRPISHGEVPKFYCGLFWPG